VEQEILLQLVLHKVMQVDQTLLLVVMEQEVEVVQEL